MSSAEHPQISVKAIADVDVVAIEQEDDLTVMLELVAPELIDPGRQAISVQVIVDRSGSAKRGQLVGAKQALVRLVDRLRIGDTFGVVAFGDEAEVVIPAGPLADKARARRAVTRLQAGGSTNLSAGLLRGIQEARRVTSDGGETTVILISDGHTQFGELEPRRLASIAGHSRQQGITLSTVAIGPGCDRALLTELAATAGGNFVHARGADEAAGAVASQVKGLLPKSVQAASLVVSPAAHVGQVTIWNDLPSNPIPGGVMAELGDLWSGESVKLVLTFAIPALQTLGLTEVATLQLRYVVAPELTEQTVRIPVHVNVVPGGEAAGRVADRKVRTELRYLKASRSNDREM